MSIENMNNIKIIKGNIFTSKAQTIVNTVNCVGVMGAGIALEFKFRYPVMYEKYVELCDQKLINIGRLWLYKGTDRWVLNFPTKQDWKFESKIVYLEKGLNRFIETYREKNIQSIAFPTLGSNNGNINEESSIALMTKYLSHCEIPVEIYRYDPHAEDDLYNQFRETFLTNDVQRIKQLTSINLSYLKKIEDEISNPKIKSLSQLASINGVGIKTLEKLFHYMTSMNSPVKNNEFKLFD